MLRIMVIRKDNDNGRPIQRVGLVLEGVREEPRCQEGDEAIQAMENEGRQAQTPPAYNRTEEGVELKYPGKVSGRRKLRDIDVARLRRNEEQLSYNEWARIYGVAMFVIWRAMKGYTYKHLNWRYPPIR